MMAVSFETTTCQRTFLLRTFIGCVDDFINSIQGEQKRMKKHALGDDDVDRLTVDRRPCRRRAPELIIRRAVSQKRVAKKNKKNIVQKKARLLLILFGDVKV